MTNVFGMSLLGRRRQRFVRLGALADQDLGTANATIDALATRAIALQNRMLENERQGVNVPQSLHDEIMHLNDENGEVQALEARISEIDHAELPSWINSANGLSAQLAHFEAQINALEGQSSTRALVQVGVGAVIVLVLAGAGAYVIRKKMR